MHAIYYIRQSNPDLVEKYLEAAANKAIREEEMFWRNKARVRKQERERKFKEWKANRKLQSERRKHLIRNERSWYRKAKIWLLF